MHFFGKHRCGGRVINVVAATMLAVAVSQTTLPGSVVGVAYAHDVVLSSTPEDGAILTAFPHEITLEFSAIPKDNFNTFAVSNTDTGEILWTATPRREEQMMSITVPSDIDPGDGNYTIGYQITSSDGHATRGKLGFTVRGSERTASLANSANPTTTHSEDQTANPGGNVTAPPASSASSAPQDSPAQSSQSSKDEGSLSSVIFGFVGLTLLAGVAVFALKRRSHS